VAASAEFTCNTDVAIVVGAASNKVTSIAFAILFIFVYAVYIPTVLII
jgi:hypothetical protein